MYGGVILDQLSLMMTNICRVVIGWGIWIKNTSGVLGPRNEEMGQPFPESRDSHPHILLNLRNDPSSGEKNQRKLDMRA